MTRIVPVIWTAVALAGLTVQWRFLRASRQDMRWLRYSGRNGMLLLVACSHLRQARIRLGVILGYVAIGVLAIVIHTDPERMLAAAIFRTLAGLVLTCGEAVLILSTWLDLRDRRRIIEGPPR